MKSFEENLEEFKITFELQSFGMTLNEAKKLNVCIACKQPVPRFKKKQIEKDYNLCGLCPRCQFGINS